MRILITTDWYAPVINGVVTSVMNLKQELEQLGHQVKVLTLSQEGTPIKVDDAYYIKSFKVRVYPQARATYSFLRNEYINEILQWQPDIIHSQCEWVSYVFAHRIAKKLDIPIVHTYHTIYDDYTHYFLRSKTISRRLIRFGANFALEHSDFIIAPTQKVHQVLTGYGVETPIAVIPTGIDLDRYSHLNNQETTAALKAKYKLADHDKVLVYVGRLAYEKNVHEIIGYMPALLQRLPNAKLILVGGGPYEDMLKDLVKKLRLEENIIFTGMVPPQETPYYYHLGDIFVCASQSEAQGLTYAEALASGCPSVCKYDKCIDGVILDGYNGYIYTSQEDFCNKAIKLLSLDRNGADYITFRHNAVKSSEIFSMEEFAKKIESVYCTLITS